MTSRAGRRSRNHGEDQQTTTFASDIFCVVQSIPLYRGRTHAETSLDNLMHALPETEGSCGCTRTMSVAIPILMIINR